MNENFELECEFKVSPSQIYTCWLDSNKHEAMTGGGADIKNELGYEYETWDGYIQGTIMKLEANKLILTTWRTTEFSDQDEDSELEILLLAKEGGTLLKLRHKNLPQGQGDSYKKGWIEHYFEPMEFYFDSL